MACKYRGQARVQQHPGDHDGGKRISLEFTGCCIRQKNRKIVEQTVRHRVQHSIRIFRFTN
ncbi:hypothetical protein D3C75_1130090 [compost metagenome]